VYAAQPLITHFRRLKVIYVPARRRARPRLVTTLIKEIVPSILTCPLIFPAGYGRHTSAESISAATWMNSGRVLQEERVRRDGERQERKNGEIGGLAECYPLARSIAD